MGRLVTLPTPVPWPDLQTRFQWGTGVPYTMTLWAILNDADDKAAIIFRVPKSGTLKRVGMRIATISPSFTLRYSLQDVDLATGLPDGTVDQFRTEVNPASGIKTPWLTSDGTDTGTMRAVTAGDYLAFVLDFTAFTSGSVNAESASSTMNFGIPYLGEFETAWAKETGTVRPAFFLEYVEHGIVPGSEYHPPFSAASVASTINTGTTPDEVGQKIVWPDFEAICEGCWVRLDLGTGDCDMVLYDAANVALRTVSIDATVDNTTGRTLQRIPWPPLRLVPGATYRLVYKPTTANNIVVDHGVMATAEQVRRAFWGEGTPAGWARTRRTDAGAWTDVDTEMMIGTALLLTAVGLRTEPRSRPTRG